MSYNRRWTRTQSWAILHHPKVLFHVSSSGCENMLKNKNHCRSSQYEIFICIRTCQCVIDTPFTKTSPNYPLKNNADNSIKIAFTNSELPKIIRTLFTSAPPKKPWKDGWACGKGVTFDRASEIVRIILELRSQIRSLVPMRLRIIAASKKCGLLWSRSDFTTK